MNNQEFIKQGRLWLDSYLTASPQRIEDISRTIRMTLGQALNRLEKSEELVGKLVEALTETMECCLRETGSGCLCLDKTNKALAAAKEQPQPPATIEYRDGTVEEI